MENLSKYTLNAECSRKFLRSNLKRIIYTNIKRQHVACQSNVGAVTRIHKITHHIYERLDETYLENKIIILEYVEHIEELKHINRFKNKNESGGNAEEKRAPIEKKEEERRQTVRKLQLKP